LFRSGRLVSRDEFVGEWTKMALVKYVHENPPKFQEQIEFLNNVIIPQSERGSIPFHYISTTIVNYRFSAFYKHCQNLSSSGDNKGDDAIEKLYSIIAEVFKDNGLEGTYESSMLE
jgi:hypothetical protein